jgi:hypothetical protein
MTSNNSTSAIQSISFVTLVIICFLLLSTGSAFGQWATSGNDVTNTNTGNVGVGNTTPRYKLDLVGSASDAQFRFGSDSSDSGGFLFSIHGSHAAFGAGASWGGGVWTARATSASFISPQSGAINFYTNSGLTSGNTFSPTLRMSLTPAGFLGVGTGTPGFPLEVYNSQNGVARMAFNNPSNGSLAQASFSFFEGSTEKAKFAVNSTGATGYIGGASAFQIWNFSNAPVVFGTNANERMRVEGNGTVGIGTTTPNSSYKLDVAGAVRSSSGGFVFPDGSIQLTAGSGTITGVTAGSGMTGGGATGTVTVTNNDKGSAQNIFKNIANAAGATQFVAGSNSDTVRFAGAGGTTVTFDGVAKQISIDASTANVAAGNIPAGQFGQNTGGGTYTFAGAVGVGTTTPNTTYKLDVAGSVRSSSGGFVFPDGTTQSTAATSQNIFKNIANSAGSTQFSASSTNDSIRFAGAGGTTVTFNSTNKQITIDGSNSNVAAANVPAGNFGANTGGGNYTFPANVTVTGTLEGGNIKAKYQDVAEWVESSQELVAGTVVVLDVTKSNQVVASTQSYDSRIAGVISTSPGIALGEEREGRVLVATTGRVKVKVDASHGPIQIGDLLVTGDKQGFAMKSVPIDIGGVRIHRPGTLIGKALEPLEKGQGEILVLLSLQ